MLRPRPQPLPSLPNVAAKEPVVLALAAPAHAGQAKNRTNAAAAARIPDPTAPVEATQEKDV